VCSLLTFCVAARSGQRNHFYLLRPGLTHSAMLTSQFWPLPSQAMLGELRSAENPHVTNATALWGKCAACEHRSGLAAKSASRGWNHEVFGIPFHHARTSLVAITQVSCCVELKLFCWRRSLLIGCRRLPERGNGMDFMGVKMENGARSNHATGVHAFENMRQNASNIHRPLRHNFATVYVWFLLWTCKHLPGALLPLPGIQVLYIWGRVGLIPKFPLVSQVGNGWWIFCLHVTDSLIYCFSPCRYFTIAAS